MFKTYLARSYVVRLFMWPVVGVVAVAVAAVVEIALFCGTK